MWNQKTKLRDFFKFFNEFDPNHLAAVDLLQEAAYAVMNDEAEWVKTYRGLVTKEKNDGYIDRAVEIISKFEGFRSSPYLCPAGIWTIGFGSTFYEDGSLVTPSDFLISREKGESILQNVLKIAFIPFLRKIPTWAAMNTNQKAAIISFAYNVGVYFYGDTDNFATITKALSSQENWPNVSKALLLYVNPGSVFEEGLKKRRKAEGELWNGTWKHT